jgi:hypothetical protein
MAILRVTTILSLRRERLLCLGQSRQAVDLSRSERSPWTPMRFRQIIGRVDAFVKNLSLDDSNGSALSSDLLTIVDKAFLTMRFS